MSYTISNSNTQTFTFTHAKYLASKVATDLKRIQRFYGNPSDNEIANYESELTEYLKCGYLSEVLYGFKRNGNWIEPTLQYKSRDLTGLNYGDDDPGSIRPNADVSAALFTSYLIPNSTYWELAPLDRESFENNLPFSRFGSPKPGVNGYFSPDKIYSSAGRALDRLTVKSF